MKKLFKNKKIWGALSIATMILVGPGYLIEGLVIGLGVLVSIFRDWLTSLFGNKKNQTWWSYHVSRYCDDLAEGFEVINKGDDMFDW